MNATNTNAAAILTITAECGKLSTTGAKFASLTYTAKESGEIARFVVLLGTNYGRLLAASLKKVELVKTATDLAAEAKQEVIASLTQSIVAFETETANPDYTCAETYQQITSGVKLHKENGTVYVSGIVISRKVINAGVHKVVNSKPLTVEKNRIKKGTAIAKWRQFILGAENMDTVRMGGREIAFMG